MKLHSLSVVIALPIIILPALFFGEIRVVAERNNNADATEEFKFQNVPFPSGKDAAAKAVFTIVDGERDGNGGDVKVLNDDKLPEEGDQPSANFFLKPSKDGGRLLVDLGSVIDVKPGIPEHAVRRFTGFMGVTARRVALTSGRRMEQIQRNAAGS
jgi:hypothetical protein